MSINIGGTDPGYYVFGNPFEKKTVPAEYQEGDTLLKPEVYDYLYGPRGVFGSDAPTGVLRDDPSSPDRVPDPTWEQQQQEYYQALESGTATIPGTDLTLPAMPRYSEYIASQPEYPLRTNQVYGQWYDEQMAIDAEQEKIDAAIDAARQQWEAENVSTGTTGRIRGGGRWGQVSATDSNMDNATFQDPNNTGQQNAVNSDSSGLLQGFLSGLFNNPYYTDVAYGTPGATPTLFDKITNQWNLGAWFLAGIAGYVLWRYMEGRK